MLYVCARAWKKCRWEFAMAPAKGKSFTFFFFFYCPSFLVHNISFCPCKWCYGLYFYCLKIICQSRKTIEETVKKYLNFIRLLIDMVYDKKLDIVRSMKPTLVGNSLVVDNQTLIMFCFVVTCGLFANLG